MYNLKYVYTFILGFCISHSYYTGVELLDLILAPILVLVVLLLIIMQNRIENREKNKEKDVTITILRYIKDDLIGYMPPKDEEFVRDQINLTIKRMRKW